MLQLSNVRKEYNGTADKSVIALEHVNIEVTEGEFIVINGPSGSGKSTLLFTMGGMLNPSGGQVLYGDMDIYAVSPARRSKIRNERMGFVFQTFNLISYLNCLENVAFPAMLSGRNKKDAMDRAEDLLLRLGLSGRLLHRPVELSVGERQRVAICRSLINEPAIVLADEPTGNMDPALTRETIDIFKDINRKGRAVVMVTHDPELSEIGTRHIFIESGAIKSDRPIYGSVQ